MSHASIDKKVREERGMPEDLIRLCVGIEDVNDLIDDLTTALVKAGAVKVTVDGICPLSKAEREKLQAEAEGKLSGPGNEQST